MMRDGRDVTQLTNEQIEDQLLTFKDYLPGWYTRHDMQLLINELRARRLAQSAA
jgi:hypothetical protein